MRSASVAGLGVSVCLAFAGCKSSASAMDMSAHKDMSSPPDLAPNVSHSKLGVRVMGYAPDTNAAMVLAACPKLVAWITPNAEAITEIKAYRSRCTGGTTVLRVFVALTVQYHGTDDPVADADDFWMRMQPGLDQLSPALIDWLEGPNEFDNIDWSSSYMTAQWYAMFWSELGDKIHGAGYSPIVGSIPAGSPPMADTDMGVPNYFQPIADAMRKKSYRWALGYHPFTFNAMNDVAANQPYVFGYRTIRDQCGLAGVPIILNDGAYLTTQAKGWQGQIPAMQYYDWLVWFDGELAKDSDVIGFAIYQIGDHNAWSTFSLDPIVPQLITYMRGQ